MNNFLNNYHNFLIEEIKKNSMIQAKLNININLIQKEIEHINKNVNHQYNKLSNPITIETLIKEDIDLFNNLLLKNNGSLDTYNWFIGIMQKFLKDEKNYQEFLKNFKKLGFHFLDSYKTIKYLNFYQILPQNKKIEFLKNYKINDKTSYKEFKQFLEVIEKCIEDIDKSDKILIINNFILNYEKELKKIKTINNLDQVLQKNFTQNEIKDFYKLLNLEYEEELFDKNSDLIFNILVEKEKLANKLKIEPFQVFNIFKNIESLFSNQKIKNKLNLEFIKFQELKGKKYFSIIILKKNNDLDTLIYKKILKEIILYMVENKMFNNGVKIDYIVGNNIIEKYKLTNQLEDKNPNKNFLKI